MSALYSERGKMGSTPASVDVNAGEFQGRRRRFPIVARNVDRYPKRRLSITGAKWAVRLNGSLVPARGTNRD
jgi:hypothetical protein